MKIIDEITEATKNGTMDSYIRSSIYTAKELCIMYRPNKIRWTDKPGVNVTMSSKGVNIILTLCNSAGVRRLEYIRYDDYDSYRQVRNQLAQRARHNRGIGKWTAKLLPCGSYKLPGLCISKPRPNSKEIACIRFNKTIDGVHIRKRWAVFSELDFIRTYGIVIKYYTGLSPKKTAPETWLTPPIKLLNAIMKNKEN